MAYNTSKTVNYSTNQQEVIGLPAAVDSTEYLVFPNGSVNPLPSEQYDIVHINNAVYITFIDDSTLASSGPFLVKRRTDLQNLRTTFYPGTNIRSQDLNTNYTQALNATQEVYDNYLDAERGVLQGTLDANFNRITNIATPTSDLDIVNRLYADGVRADVNAKYAEVLGFRNETEQFRDDAEVAKDFLQGIYLGSYSEAPVNSNNEFINPHTQQVLTADDNGAFYYNSTSKYVFVYEHGLSTGPWRLAIEAPLVPFTQNDTTFASYSVTFLPPTETVDTYWPEYLINVGNFPTLTFPAGSDKALVMINGAVVPAGAVIIEGTTLRLNLNASLSVDDYPSLPSNANPGASFAPSSDYVSSGRIAFTAAMPSSLRNLLVNSPSTAIDLTVIAFGDAIFGAAGWNYASYSDGVISLTSITNPELNIVTDDLRPSLNVSSVSTTQTLANANVTYTQVGGSNAYDVSYTIPYVAPSSFSINSSYQPVLSFSDGSSFTSNFSMQPSYISDITFTNYEPTFEITHHDGTTTNIVPGINLRGAPGVDGVDGQSATLSISNSVTLGNTPGVTVTGTSLARNIALTLPKAWLIDSTDPSSSDGVDGQMAYNTSSQTIFGPKTSGSWGTGHALNGWVISNGVPTVNDGINGQMAFDYANFAFYGPKTTNGWGTASYVSVDPDIGVLASISADIETLADIEDGTTATSSIQTVAANATEVAALGLLDAEIQFLGEQSASGTALRQSFVDVYSIATEIQNVDSISTEIGIIGLNSTAGTSLRDAISLLGANTTAGTDLRADIALTAAVDGEISALSPYTAEIAVLGDTTSTGTTLRSNIGTLGPLSTEIGILGANTTSAAGVRDGISIIGEDTLGGVTLRNSIKGLFPYKLSIDALAPYVAEVAILGDTTSTGTTLRSAINVLGDPSVNGISLRSDLYYCAAITSDITTVAGLLNEILILGDPYSTGITLRSNIATVASSINDVNRYATEYTIDANAPSTPSAGDLWYDETNNVLKYYTSTNWIEVKFEGNINTAITQTVQSVSSLNIDCNAGNYFTETINANSTFTVSNVPASGTVYSFTLELTHTSGAVTWWSGLEWPGGTAPTLTTGKTHLFVFVTDDGGTRWRGAALVDYTN